MPSYTLHYFNARGRGEVARFIMVYGGIDYEDKRYTREEWLEFKPKTPFGQMPVLEVDGTLIAQSGAIFQHLAKKAGLNGKNDMEETLIRMICDTSDDLLKPMGAIYMEQDETRKAALKKKYADEQLPAALAGLEKYMEKNNCTDHFVGGQMSMADIRVAYDSSWPAFMGIEIDLSKYPRLKAVQDNVNNHPKIAAWIAKRPVTDM